jgi:hypothetical protein
MPTENNIGPKYTSDKSPQMLKVMNDMAVSVFGISYTDALYEGICIGCRNKVEVSSLPKADADEYIISALCPECWQRIMNEGDSV